MKYLIVTIVFSVFSLLPKAQQSMVAEAVLQPGGRKVLKVTDASGKTTIINGNSNAEIQEKYSKLLADKQSVSVSRSSAQSEPVFVSHQSVLLKNGTQEMRWRDAAGNERVITATKGESIQAKYLAYIKKEGLSCGCSPALSNLQASQSETKIATKP